MPECHRATFRPDRTAGVRTAPVRARVACRLGGGALAQLPALGLAEPLVVLPLGSASRLDSAPPLDSASPLGSASPLAGAEVVVPSAGVDSVGEPVALGEVLVVGVGDGLAGVGRGGRVGSLVFGGFDSVGVGVGVAGLLGVGLGVGLGEVVGAGTAPITRVAA